MGSEKGLEMAQQLLTMDISFEQLKTASLAIMDVITTTSNVRQNLGIEYASILDTNYICNLRQSCVKHLSNNFVYTMYIICMYVCVCVRVCVCVYIYVCVCVCV